MGARCEDGRLLEHRPQPDDPHFEQDIGPCVDCDCGGEDAEISICDDCGAHVSDDGYSIDDRACFYCKP